MGRVKSFNIAQSRQKALLAFLLAVITRAQCDEKVAELCNNQLKALIAAYYLLEELAQRHRMNLLTDEVNKADTWRDVNLTKVRAAIRAQTKNPDLAKSQAAELLWKITDEVGRVHDQQFDVETGTLTTYCLDLLQNHLEEVELIGVKADVEALQAANNHFIDILAARTDIDAEYQKGESQRARQLAINAYRDFVLIIESKVLEGHLNELAPFINYLNAEVDRMRIALGQGTGNVGNGTGNDAENTPTKNINFIYHNGTQLKKWFVVGAPVIAPENTPGYMWKDLPEIMPRRSKTVREVVIDPEKFTATFHFFDHREEVIKQAAGTELTAPENTEGFVWVPTVPALMPAEDTTYFELQDEEENTEQKPGEGTEQQPGTGTEQQPTLYKITYMHKGQVYAVQDYEVGARITTIDPPEGYYWRETTPGIMPAHDITITSTDDPYGIL